MLAAIQSEAWSLMVSGSTYGHYRFAKITQVGLKLRLTQKYTTLILQQIWSDIESQTCIMGWIPALNLGQIIGTGKLSMAIKNHKISNESNK